MPRENEGQEPTEGQEPQEPMAPTGQGPSGAEPGAEPQTFDAEYVQELRNEAAKWRKQLREAQERLEAIERAKTQEEEERLKQQEKFKELAETREQRIAELETELEERELRLQEWKNERAISDAAHELGIAPKLARRVFPYADLKHDDEGNPINAKELLEATIEEFGLKPEKAKAGVPPSPAPGGDGKLTEEEKRRRAWRPRSL
jgi:DNA repair exonuclease SbcCD ATPase subunit